MRIEWKIQTRHAHLRETACIEKQNQQSTQKMSSHDKNLHQFLLHRDLLQNLSDDLGSLLVGREQFFALFALVLDGVVLIQKLSEQILLVQLADKSVLDNILGVVDKQMHDCFGHLVCNRLSYDVEV